MKNDYRIYVVSKVDQYIKYIEDYPSVTHIPLHELDRKSSNPVKDIKLTMEFMKIYKKIRPDIILHYTVKPNIFGGLAAALLKIPSIAVVTGLGYAFIHKGLVNKITIVLYRLVAPFQKQIIFENSHDLALFRELKILKSDQGIHVNGCGVDLAKFKLNRSPKNIQEKTLIISFIGRLLYDKGIIEFIKAAELVLEKYKHVQFWIVGKIDHKNPSAIQEEELISWTENPRIKYKGYKNNIKSYISRSTSIVLPSYREGLPKILLEGMAMEKPLIATDVPGCRDAVEENKNGFLVPAGSINQLAEAMEKMILLSVEERMKMGQYGRAKAIRLFDEQIIARQILDIVENQLKSSSIGPLPR
jgi:glycosyltransferase involved in cell wall biosynthesis